MEEYAQYQRERLLRESEVREREGGRKGGKGGREDQREGGREGGGGTVHEISGCLLTD